MNSTTLPAATAMPIAAASTQIHRPVRFRIPAPPFPIILIPFDEPGAGKMRLVARGSIVSSMVEGSGFLDRSVRRTLVGGSAVQRGEAVLESSAGAAVSQE